MQFDFSVILCDVTQHTGESSHGVYFPLFWIRHAYRSHKYWCAKEFK